MYNSKLQCQSECIGLYLSIESHFDGIYCLIIASKRMANLATSVTARWRACDQAILKRKLLPRCAITKESKTRYLSCNLPDLFIVMTINAYTSHQEAFGEKWE